MKRNPALHPLSWEHHSALTAIVLVRRQIEAGVPEVRLRAIAREFVDFHRDALRPHFRHEEEWLLPRLLGHLSLQDDLVSTTLHDHVAIHRLVLELDVAERDGRDPRSALVRLMDRLEAHVRFEERELFVKVEACLSPEEMDALGRQLHNSEMPAVVIPGSDGVPVRPGPQDHAAS